MATVTITLTDVEDDQIELHAEIGKRAGETPSPAQLAALSMVDTFASSGEITEAAVNGLPVARDDGRLN